MDSQMMREALPQYLQAMVLTLKLASGGILLALLIGMTIGLISFLDCLFLSKSLVGMLQYLVIPRYSSNYFFYIMACLELVFDWKKKLLV